MHLVLMLPGQHKVYLHQISNVFKLILCERNVILSLLLTEDFINRTVVSSLEQGTI